MAPETALLTLEDALTQLLAGVSPVTETETVALRTADARILATPLRSDIAVPGFANSAMDGYAFASTDVRAGAGALPIAGRIIAGDAPGVLTPGCASRIFTGAPLPAGADTVVLQEDCAVRDGQLILPPVWRCGSHVRQAGEDIAEGSEVLAAGRRLRPQDVGLAAACGHTAVTVRRRLRVTLMTTGNELRTSGSGPLAPGQIYDSNRPMLRALLERLDCTVTDVPPLADDFAATRAALRTAAAAADVIVATGGVSVGEEDYVRAALEAEGVLRLWRIGIKPGKPLAYGRIGSCYFLGLPGNPVSGFVTFLLFVRPFLAALGGERLAPPPRFLVRADFARPKPDRRREFLRAQLHVGDDGAPQVRPFLQQSSGVLSSTSWADGLVDIEALTTVAIGDLVRFLPFSGLLP
ncbi:MAG: molybdopterin molybdotransferase MoeA [Acidiferrobacter sp.]